MRLSILLLSASAFLSLCPSMAWDAEELKQANTAADVPFMNPMEQETLHYINLARLYPEKFLELELKDYKGPQGYAEIPANNSYRKSLERHLKKMKAVSALHPDSLLTQTARCLADEQGPTGRKGHYRRRCNDDYSGECISYGMQNGKDIAMQLLIDKGVSSLGHRKICLSGTYKQAGVAEGPHKKYGRMVVLDFK